MDDEYEKMRKARIEHMRKMPKGFLAALISVFTGPTCPPQSASEVARRQLRDARGVLARERNCRPEDIGVEDAVAMAQIIATNELAAQERGRK
jgi:hypothetical protein